MSRFSRFSCQGLFICFRPTVRRGWRLLYRQPCEYIMMTINHHAVWRNLPLALTPRVYHHFLAVSKCFDSFSLNISFSLSVKKSRSTLYTLERSHCT